MPSMHKIGAKLSNIPDSKIQNTCEQTTVEQYETLSAHSPRAADKYSPVFNGIFENCHDTKKIKHNMEGFNGIGQKMTKAGSVYIPLKFDKSVINDLHKIAKDEMSKTKDKNNNVGHKEKILEERSQNSRSNEL